MSLRNVEDRLHLFGVDEIDGARVDLIPDRLTEGCVGVPDDGQGPASGQGTNGGRQQSTRSAINESESATVNLRSF